MEFKRPFGRIGSDLWANSRLKQIMRLIGKPEGKTILDLGCSMGYMGLEFVQNNDVYFVDINQEALDKIHPNHKIFNLDITKEMPFGEKYFDIIFCTDVVEHIEYDQKVFRNVHKHLKDDGIFVLTVPAFLSLYGHHDRLIGHHRRYDRKPLIRLLDVMGFKPEFVRYNCSLMFFPFVVNQKISKAKELYSGTSKLEGKILPLLNTFSRIEGKLNLPWGIGLTMILKKHKKN